MKKQPTPTPLRHLPSTVEVVDQSTGESRVERTSCMLLPPAKDRCQICATKHEPEWPHNAQSMYYAMAFNSMHGRSPTWADAVAHCSIEMQARWEKALRDKGHWTEPPAGEDPITHHGVD